MCHQETDDPIHRETIEKILCDLSDLDITISTIVLGMAREEIEPQVIAGFKCIQNNIAYIRQTAKQALEARAP